ncbi:MAG: hypothetical protein R2698_05220 [Microthrixaceae bacterium]
MGFTDDAEDNDRLADTGCRHCSGLCAGRNARCPYCKKWLRREPVTVGAPAAAGLDPRSKV